MIPVIDSVIPVFLLIATGWLARVSGLIEERHWTGIEQATYFIFFPAIIIDTLARADLGSVPVLGVGGALVGAILLIAVALLALGPSSSGRSGSTGRASRPCSRARPAGTRSSGWRWRRRCSARAASP